VSLDRFDSGDSCRVAQIERLERGEEALERFEMGDACRVAQIEATWSAVRPLIGGFEIGDSCRAQIDRTGAR